MKQFKNLHGVPLFSTQIYYKKLQSSSAALKPLNKELSIEAYQMKSNDEEGHDWSQLNYRNGYTSYGSSASGYDRMHLVSSTFQSLQKKIDKHVDQYLKMLDYDANIKDLAMTHCWVNIMPKNAHHTAHIHPLSVISGTYYVDCPVGCSGLRFEDPRFSQFMNSPAVKLKPQLGHERIVELAPKNGYVVLFESWLKHEVPASEITKDRVSISFNYGWR